MKLKPLRTNVPRHKQEHGKSMHSDIKVYKLTDTDREVLAAGGSIPTAEHRQDVKVVPYKRPEALNFNSSRPQLNGGRGRYITGHVTREALKEAMDSGMNYDELAAHFKLPRGSVSHLVTRFGLGRVKRMR